MSGIGTGTALMIGGIGAAGSIGSAAFGAHAAGKAAKGQSNAAMYAADLQHQDSQEALAFQKQQWEQDQANLEPWLKSGKQGLSQLDYMLGLGGQPTQNLLNPDPNGVNTSLGGYGSLMQDNPYSKFTAPDNLTEQNDPGYQARLKLSTDAMQRSAAARGSVLTGGTARDLNQFAQDYASNEYGSVYNRAFNTNASNYNSFSQNQANKYNKLASLSGMGQQTANQLGLLGNQASQNISNNLLSTGQMMGQDYQNAAAANASGYIGGANAWGGALGGLGGNFSNLMLMRMLQGGGGYPSYGGSGGSDLNIFNGLFSH